MSNWLWIVTLGLIGGGILILVLRLYGVQIIAGVMIILTSKAWEAFKEALPRLLKSSVETQKKEKTRVREGRERGGKDR